MDKPKWTRLSEFPASSGSWSSYYPLLFMRIDGEERVLRHLRTANLTFPILLSSPQTHGKYVPPILLDSKRLSAKLIRESRIMLFMTLIMLFFGTIAFYFASDLIGALVFFSVFLTLSLYAAFNFRQFGSDSNALSERWQFYAWSFSKPPVYVLGFLIAMIVIGIAQLYGAKMLTSEGAKIMFGLIYDEMSSSQEWWRFLTAPYIHNSFAHWTINTLVGSGFLLVYAPTLQWRIVTIIPLTASLSFLAVYGAHFIFPLDSEGIIGVSGGLSGIVGYFLAANIRFAASFPRNFYVTTLFVAVSTLLVVSVATSITSFIVHLAGFVLGVLLGFAGSPISRSFYLDSGPASSPQATEERAC